MALMEMRLLEDTDVQKTKHEAQVSSRTFLVPTSLAEIQ
jgi:hypothetical protein